MPIYYLGVVIASLLPLEANVSCLSLQCMQWSLYKSCGRQSSFFAKNQTVTTLVSFSFHSWSNRTDTNTKNMRDMFYFTLCCSNSCLFTVAKEDPRAAGYFLWTRLRRALLLGP